MARSERITLSDQPFASCTTIFMVQKHGIQRLLALRRSQDPDEVVDDSHKGKSVENDLQVSEAKSDDNSR